MNIPTPKIFQWLNGLAWVIFIGLCIQGGEVLFNAVFTLAINPIDAKHFLPGIDFSSLYAFGKGYFAAETTVMVLAAVVKAYMFYLIISILTNKKLNMAQPFSTEVGRFIFKLSYLALTVGVLSWAGIQYGNWLEQRGVKLPDMHSIL